MRQTAKFRTTILGNDKVNGKSYRSTVAVMGGKFMVGVSAENRRIVGVAAGDKVDVTLELDTEPRKALAEYAAANKFFDVAGPFIRVMVGVGTSWSLSRWTAASLCAVLLMTACTPTSGVPAASRTSSPTPTPTLSATAAPTATASPQSTPTPREEPPPVATEPVAMAVQLASAERAVRDPNVTGAELAWMGHLQQRIYRTLAARPELRDPVLTALPPTVRAYATKNLSATADLRSTVVPGPDLPTAWRIVEPAPLDELARYYREAEAEFGVHWSYLAAIHLVETRMGRIRGVSTAGAQGPMQFMPGTWAAYGEGDVNSNRDAIRAAARYLRANRAPADMPNALFRYNNSQPYVRAVTAYAEVMRTEPDAYRGYYHWQVYYLTTRGDILLPVGYGP